MNFLQFCRTHGLIVASVQITHGKKTIRVPTTEAPREKKGWYRYDGRHGACGIWRGLDPGTQVYKPGADAQPMSAEELARIHELAAEHERKQRARWDCAAAWARSLLSTAEMRSHAYLSRKGFPDVFAPTIDDGETLLVTMWKDKAVCNLQLIKGALPETPEQKERQKLFLPGAEVMGLAHRIGDQGQPVHCEGYATGLSIAAAIRAARVRAHCVVWFTAGNMAANARGGVVVADNDSQKTSTGEKAAIKTGLKYWMPETPGFDANDYHKAEGIFSLAMKIKALLCK